MPSNIHPTALILLPPADLLQAQPHLGHLANELSARYASGQSVSEAQLKAMGSALWNSIAVELPAVGNAITAILLQSDSPAVQALPWETLYHPTLGFLGRHPAFTLSRRSAPAQPAVFPIEKGPLRVLLFTSMPDDLNAETQRLNVEEEQIQVQEALLPLIAAGIVRLEMPDDGRFSTFKTLIKDFQPHLLFLSGHGNFNHQPHTGQAPYAEFLFEGEDGNRQLVDENEIALALTGSGLQAVVLSACESGKAASTHLNNGLTQKLSAQGIPHVTGMRESIKDAAGLRFARRLFDELARAERFDYALQSARAAIFAPQEQSGSASDWCLPVLYSPEPARALIDWDFKALQPHPGFVSQGLSSLRLPARFVGRRAEMRQFKGRLQSGDLTRLLITGAGGQGKTALAGKLALDLQARGWQVFDWSARPENPWRKFQFDLELALSLENAAKYDRLSPRFENEYERAATLLGLLQQQFGPRLVILLDNLETLQHPVTRALDNSPASAWLQAALARPGLVLLVTSRWLIPDWSGEHLALAHAPYGDFLQMVQALVLNAKMPAAFLGQRERLRQVYRDLDGNGRALTWLGGALLSLKSQASENAFLERLAQTRKDIQADMAIQEIHAHLPEPARALLSRLPVYPAPVPLEGIIKLALDLPGDPDGLLAALLSFSLVETQYEPDWQMIQYQCPALVSDWLQTQQLLDKDPRWLDAAADYQVYRYKYERRSLSQAVLAHTALRRAGRKPQADRLALDAIVGPLEQAGYSQTLLKDWLPDICQSEDPAVLGEALGQTGKQYLLTGEYDTALEYLQKSIVIFQQIGDTSGESAALNNISQFFKARGDYDTALEYLQKSLVICQQIGDTRGEGAALNNISQIFKARGDYDTALEYMQKALAIQQQIGNRSGEGSTLNNISQIYQARGDYDTALEYLRKALVIWQQIGDTRGESATLNNIANNYQARGDYDTALAYLQKSLGICQQIGDTSGEGTTLNNISLIYHARGDYDTALEYLQKALAIQQQIGDTSGEGQSLNNISGVYQARGDYDTALAYLQKSLVISQQIGDTRSEGAALNNISQIYDARGDYDTALEYLQKSLVISQQIGDIRGEGTTINNISQISQARGDYDTALEYLQKSLVISQQNGDRSGLCSTLFNIGINHYLKQNILAAVSAWVNSYLIAKQIGQAQVLQALAKFAPTLGLPEGLDGWDALAQKMQPGPASEGAAPEPAQA